MTENDTNDTNDTMDTNDVTDAYDSMDAVDTTDTIEATDPSVSPAEVGKVHGVLYIGMDLGTSASWVWGLASFFD